MQEFSTLPDSLLSRFLSLSAQMQHNVWERSSWYQILFTNLLARSQDTPEQQRFPYPLVALPSTGIPKKIPASCINRSPYHEVSGACICTAKELNLVDCYWYILCYLYFKKK